MIKKIIFSVLFLFLLYMVFSFFNFFLKGTLSEKEVSFERGFYQLSVVEPTKKVNEFILLTCIHCINTMDETSLFFNENKINLLRVHPYYNDNQKVLSIFFYLCNMDLNDSNILGFIDYLHSINRETAANITLDELYTFYIKLNNPDKILTRGEFELTLKGEKNSEFLSKANLAKSKAEKIGLKATPAFLYGNKITSFSLFSKNSDMLHAIKSEILIEN